MRFRLSQAFMEERREFCLRHTCEDCAHFDPTRAACVHGYPIDDHVESSLQLHDAELVFCKEFELL